VRAFATAHPARFARPLLVASLTRDAFLVSMALTAQWLPMLLFGMGGGVAADRLDRRRMVVVVNLARAGVLLALVALVVTETLTIAWALVVLFVLGTAETFADSASSTLLPSLVARKDLGVANARMQGAFLLANQMVAPPIGAALFAAGMALPFAANAAAFVLGATLISRIVGSMRSERTEVAGVWADTVEGLRWLVGHPPMRTLTLTIFAFNVTFGAGWSVLVLYAGERLGMGEVGFGLLMTAVAIGGVIGTVSYGALERRFRLASLLPVGCSSRPAPICRSP
jgi:MFS-type transporter involved in bile tolerance (Atg22 family)